MQKRARQKLMLLTVSLAIAVLFLCGFFAVFDAWLSLAPNGKTDVFDMRASVSSLSSSNDNVFQVGQDVFYSGSHDVIVNFKFPLNTDKINIRVVEGGSSSGTNRTSPSVSENKLIEEQQNIEASGLQFNLSQHSLQSYKLQIQFIDGEQLGDWTDVIYVHDASKYQAVQEITESFDLNLLSAHVNFGFFDGYSSKTVTLGRDLVLPDFYNNHIQIGNKTHPSFKGTFDGASKKISNIKMFKENGSLGFFNDFRGVVKDLTISGQLEVEDNSGDTEIVTAGFAVTCTNAIIINSVSDMHISVNSVSPQNIKAAGFVGSISGKATFINSGFSGSISSSGENGAFVAKTQLGMELNLINCVDDGSFTDAKGNKTEAISVNEFLVVTEKGQDPLQEYTLTWINNNEAEQTTNEFFNAKPTLPASPVKAPDGYNSYKFIGWLNSKNQPPSSVTGNEIYYATYQATPIVYTLIWVNYDGSHQATTEFYDATPTLPLEPTKQADNYNTYKFVGWIDNNDQAPSKVAWDKAYFAKYQATPIPYTLTWVNYDGSKQTTSEHYNVTPKLPSNPTKPSDKYNIYKFIGWFDADGKSPSKVAGNETYYAEFQAVPISYKLTWVNYDGSQQITIEHYNATPTMPFAPIIPSDNYNTYEFTGWFNIFGQTPSNVVSDETYYSRYQANPIVYTLTWVDYDGSEKTTEHSYGDTPLPPENLIRPDEGLYKFEFVGWNTQPQQSIWDTPTFTLKNVSSNVTYYAVYRVVHGL